MDIKHVNGSWLHKCIVPSLCRIVSVGLRSYMLVQQVFFPSVLPLISSSSPFVPFSHMWQLCCQHVHFKWRPASYTAYPCIPAFILASEVQQQTCMAAQGGKGSLPQWIIWTFPLCEMASQRPCMINVSTLIYTVLSSWIFENFLWMPLGRSRDVWLAISLLFNLCNCPCNAMHSGEHTHPPSNWVALCPNKLINGYQCSVLSMWMSN